MKKLLISLLVLWMSPNLGAQNAGTYPAEPFNGLQVNYSITGATISKYTDVPGFTCTRSLVITGVQKGGVLGISGSMRAGGYGATVTVSVTAGGKTGSSTYEVKPASPVSFSQQVAIPQNATTASIRINMHGHYSMGGGSRYVVVQGDWSERWGAENKSVDPNKGKPEPSQVAVLKDLLKIYNSKIPAGIVSDGPTNNKLWWFDNKYDEYVCGSYQSKILTMFDNIKYGGTPEQKKWLEKFDYGPIETNCGVIPGGHQAFVIYPKGTNWRETGTILDPWPEQKPKSYTVEEWKKIFPHGLNPSGYYKGQYQICGGTGKTDPRKAELTTAENNWYKTLPNTKQDVYKNIKDVTERKRRMKIDYANRTYDSRTLADCPLDVYVIDERGRVSGFPAGVLRTEIQDVSVNRILLDDGTYWTEIAYPAGKDYTVMFKGSGTGNANIYSGFKMQSAPGTRDVYKYSLPVNNGKVYALDVMEENQHLKLLDSYQATQDLVSGTRITSISSDDDGSDSGDWGPEEKLFDNGNIYGVTNGPTNKTQFTLNRKTLVTKIQDYHYFNYGAKPGTISLMNERGERFGPWKATGSSGQGNVPNAYWFVTPGIILPAGTYTVFDSDPGTWSTNSQSGNSGHTAIWGRTIR